MGWVPCPVRKNNYDGFLLAIFSDPAFVLFATQVHTPAQMIQTQLTSWLISDELTAGLDSFLGLEFLKLSKFRNFRKLFVSVLEFSQVFGPVQTSLDLFGPIPARTHLESVPIHEPIPSSPESSVIMFLHLPLLKCI